MIRCDKGAENGLTRLAGVRCPYSLAFDIERQTCDWKTNVKNCDKLESKYNGVDVVAKGFLAVSGTIRMFGAKRMGRLGWNNSFLQFLTNA